MIKNIYCEHDGIWYTTFYRCHCNTTYKEKENHFYSVPFRKKKKFYMPRAGIEPALSGPQPDVLPLYYRGESKIIQIEIIQK